jgi:hypothetical protein
VFYTSKTVPKSQWLSPTKELKLDGTTQPCFTDMADSTWV